MALKAQRLPHAMTDRTLPNYGQSGQFLCLNSKNLRLASGKRVADAISGGKLPPALGLSPRPSEDISGTSMGFSST